MRRTLILSSLFIAASLAGCATKPTGQTASLKTSYAETTAAKQPLEADDAVSMNPNSWKGRKTSDSTDSMKTGSIFGGSHNLAGRTLTVSSLHELKLGPKEVILTFDDGPMPGKTEKIMATLDAFGVKAAFMMVGEMAQAHPALARKVRDNGETIGSHTFKHPDLAKMNFDMAVAEIVHGQSAVSKAIGEDVNFFRFPYLADSRKLRSAVAGRDLVVMDVDVDSKDYFGVKPAAVVKRTMDELHQRGRGIILMHDIHQRTAAMLPTLLTRLEEEGYKVVTLKFGKPSAPAVMAQADTTVTR